MIDIKPTTQLHAEDMRYLRDTDLLEKLVKNKITIRYKSTESVDVARMKYWLSQNANARWHHRDCGVETQFIQKIVMYFT